jgi:hypothetical protein
MAKVTIKPLPSWCRELPEDLWPQHPPIFDDQPTAEDVALARALIEELDPASQRWYRGAEGFEIVEFSGNPPA